MKFKLVGLISVLVMVAALVSCTIEPIMNPDDITERKTVFENFVLKQSTIYFGEERGKYCEVVDTNTVIIKSDIPEALMPKVGEVIFVPLSESVPDGFLGKVKSISDASGAFLLKTQEVSLDEVFDELHIDQTISISRLMDKVLDEEGNLIECGILPDEVWGDAQHVMDSLGMVQPKSVLFTKAEFEHSQTFTRSIPFKYQSISGEFVLSASLSVKLDISKGMLQEYDINLSKKSFINVSVEASAKGNTRKNILPLKTYRLPVSIPIGPIVLRPAILCSLDFLTSGEIKIGTNIGIGVEDVNTRWHNGEKSVKFGEGSSNYIGAYYLDADGSLGFESRLAIQFGVYGQKLLAFGIDVLPKVNVGVSGQVEMNNRDLLKSNIYADVSISGSVGIYLYCKFFSSSYDNLRASVDMPSRTWKLGIFDKGSGFNVKKSSGEWSVNGSFGYKQFMSVDEKGIALFHEGDYENPVDMKMMFSKTQGANVRTANSDKGKEVVFILPDNTSRYEVRPYNIVRSEYGEYVYFGEPIIKLIKRIEVDGDGSYYYEFEYDSNHRLSKVSTTHGEVWKYSYYEDRIVFHSQFDTVTGYLDEEGRLTKTIDEYNDGTNSNTSVTSFTYDVNNNPSISTSDYSFSNGNHISDNGWRTYEYGDEVDAMNLDIFHVLIASSYGLELFIPFYSFPYIHNANLCTGFTNFHEFSKEHFDISYNYDLSGNVKAVYIGNVLTIRLYY